MALSRRWAGNIYGTNVGEFFLQLEDTSTDAELIGTLRIMDHRFGLTVFEVKGSYTDTLTLAGKAVGTPEGIIQGDIEVVGGLTEGDRLRGNWSSSIGTAGTFVAYPHDQEKQQASPSDDRGPEQLFTTRIELGALRLYPEAIAELTRVARRDFTAGRIIVTYIARGNEVTRYLDDFELDAPKLGPLRRFKLHIQEPEHGVNKVTTVDLNAFGRNEVLVQGANESWVTGKAEALARTLREHESFIITNYKKFGLTLNQMIFMAMLVFIPAIDTLWQRALFVLGVLGLLQLLVWLHSQFIPVLVMYPSTVKPSVFAKGLPTLLSWVGTVVSGLAAAYLFYVLTGKPPG